MPEVVYALCALLSVSCAVFLFRGFKSSRVRLLFWGSLAFSMIALNNLILFADLVVFPEIDFGGGVLRNLAGAIGAALLLFGLIWEGA